MVNFVEDGSANVESDTISTAIDVKIFFILVNFKVNQG
jgi:hypothetical protein